MSALGRRRAAIHQWIRDDLPLSAKMILTPRHVDALEARLDAAAAPDSRRCDCFANGVAPEMCPHR